jgi:hypothetical protein
LGVTSIFLCHRLKPRDQVFQRSAQCRARTLRALAILARWRPEGRHRWGSASARVWESRRRTFARVLVSDFEAAQSLSELSPRLASSASRLFLLVKLSSGMHGKPFHSTLHFRQQPSQADQSGRTAVCQYTTVDTPASSVDPTPHPKS